MLQHSNELNYCDSPDSPPNPEYATAMQSDVPGCNRLIPVHTKYREAVTSGSHSNLMLFSRKIRGPVASGGELSEISLSFVMPSREIQAGVQLVQEA